MLTVSRLRKEFTGVVAVDDVSFRVARGSIFGLIGPNGAGKSTAIRMIMDIIQPDRGTIAFDDRLISASGRNLTGYLPEERGLYRKSRLADVVCYFAALKGLDRPSALRAAAPWLERLGLAGQERRTIEELSKGNQQKVQFLVSVLHDPELLVLDEVFSGLDPVNQVVMKDTLLELRADNRVILFSTHQMDSAERLCDELVLINKGRVVLDGAPSDIKARHGKNTVQVSFRGDGAFLRDAPGVLRADISQNFAELELDSATTTNAVIERMLPRLELASVARIEPSLQSVFIDTVGMPEPETEPAPLPARPPGALTDARIRKAFINVVGAAVFALVFLVMYLRAPSGKGLAAACLMGVLTVVGLARFRRVKREVRAGQRSAGDKP